MPEAKSQDGRQIDRENETRPPAAGQDWPADLDLLFRDLDDLLGQIAAKSSLYSDDDPLLPSTAMRAVLQLAGRRLEDIESGSAHTSSREESTARIEDAWRHAMIEAQGWAHRGASGADGGDNVGSEPTVDVLRIAFADDLRRLVRKKVESGQFPSEEAVVVAALRLFLLEGSPERYPQPDCATGFPEGRLPGPFIEDEMVPAPGDFPRSGQEVACIFLHDSTREPDLFPGE